MAPRFILTLLAALLFVFSADTAFAASPSATRQAEALSAQAEEAYGEGRFADAIRLYLDAWETVPTAGLLYNVAFIYERRLEDLELALNYYRKAFASRDADADMKDRAGAKIASLEATLKAQSVPATPTTPATPTPPTDVTPPRGDGAAPPTRVEPGPSRQTVYQQTETHTPAGAWVTLGTGGAVLLGGVVVGIIANDTAQDFKDATRASEKRRLQEEGRQQALIGDIMMGAGALALTAGIIWAIVGTEEVVKEDAAFWIEPQVISGGAALTVGGKL